ncbi:MAG: FtsX-like permease family protein [Chitinispirillia bacterium]|jgi:ABC-type lipoprotein release transport system permease subunit
MPVILNIAFRNLIRQKRRSLLLGIAIAFGSCILILANAFSHGISQVLFERIVKYTNGHVSISFMKNGNMMNQIFHDGDRMYEIIKRKVPEALRIEEAIGIFGRAIGNGVADNVIMVGVNLSNTLTEDELKEFSSNFKMIEGSFEALSDTVTGIPVVVAEQKAKYLKVGMGDNLKVRFTGVNNQTSSANLVIVGIFKPANIFMSSPIFLNLKNARILAGYGPHDIPSIQINLKDAQKNAKRVADTLYGSLKPDLAVMEGIIERGDNAVTASVMGFKKDSLSNHALGSSLKLVQGDSLAAFSRNGIIATYTLSQLLGIKKGDSIHFSWQGRYETSPMTTKFIVTAIARSTDKIPINSLLVNEQEFYRWYYMQLPALLSESLKNELPDSTHTIFGALCPEYTLMKRASTTGQYSKLFREMSRKRIRGVVVSVQSMYETASAIINVEVALNLITLVAGLVLFFVILIGVVNTLRMTIKERTREIGTVRAIGMQRSDVLKMFLAETALLAFFASLTGAILSFILMKIIASFPIDPGENPMGMLLVDNRIFFAPTAFATIGYILIIVCISVGTAFFPSKRASKLSAAKAMRHYE